MLNLSCISTFLKKCIQNVVVKFEFWSNTITLSNLWCLHQPWRKGYAVSNADCGSHDHHHVRQLANQSTITKMASPCGYNKLVLKSMDTFCHGLGIINDGCRAPAYFGKRLGSLGTLFKPSQSGFSPSSCTINNTFLTQFYGGICFFYDQQWDYHILLSKPIASICLVTHTPKFSYIWAIRPPNWPLWVAYFTKLIK